MPGTSKGNPVAADDGVSVEKTSGDSPEVLTQFREYARTRDPRIRDRIVLEYAPLVQKLARKYSNLGEPLEDLTQEGYVGLVKAVDQFKPGRGVKFNTYATHVVSGEIRHYLRDLGKLIKEPAWLQELRFRVGRAADELTQKLSRPPTISEIARHMNIAESEVAEVVRTKDVFFVESLDHGTDESDENGEETLAGSRLPDEKERRRTPFEERLVLRQAVARLKKLERAAIYSFFYREYSKTEIAKQLGVSVNFVSYLVRQGLTHLKEILTREEMKEALLRLRHMETQISDLRDTLTTTQPLDPVTGLYTREPFESRILDEAARANRYHLEFSVAGVRILEWKDIVAVCTRVELEGLLRNIAQALRENVREVDCICRYDQNAFAVLMPHTGMSSAIVAGRLERSLKRLFRPGYRQRAKRTTARQRKRHNAAPLETQMRVIAFPQDAHTGQVMIDLLRLFLETGDGGE